MRCLFRLDEREFVLFQRKAAVTKSTGAVKSSSSPYQNVSRLGFNQREYNDTLKAMHPIATFRNE